MSKLFIGTFVSLWNLLAVAGYQNDTPLSKALQQHTLDIHSFEINSPSQDLIPLKKILSGNTVVALGESTHGTKEFFLLKHRLLSFLTRELNYTVLALEISFTEAQDLNEYVLRGKGNLPALLSKLYWIYNTQEMMQVIEWIRTYNQMAPTKIKFYGIDIPFSNKGLQALKAYYTKVDPATLRIFTPFSAHFTTNGLYSYLQMPADQKREWFTTLEELMLAFKNKKKEYVNGSSSQAYELHFQYWQGIKQAFMHANQEKYGPVRDSIMAENIRWILDFEGKESKLMLWAHNTHISKSENALGNYLQKLYNKQYYAVGFDFYQGSFHAKWDRSINNGNKGVKPITSYIKDPIFTLQSDANSIGYVLEKAGKNICLLETSNPQYPDVLRKWVNTPMEINSIGAAYVVNHTSQNLLLPKHFDAVLFCKTSSPTTLITPYQQVRPIPTN